jgi:branched-chain amino acid transport system permease protein
VPAWLGDNLVTVVDGVAFGVLLFTIAVGLSLVFGVMDVLNLAHGALYLAGAYLAVRFVGDGQATIGGYLLAGLAAVAVGAGAGAGLALLTARWPAGAISTRRC